MVFLKRTAKKLVFLMHPSPPADGFSEAQNAWQTLFPSIIIILCFLHVFLKLKKNKNKFNKLFWQLSQKLWQCYEAPSRRTFVKKTQTFITMVFR